MFRVFIFSMDNAITSRTRAATDDSIGFAAGSIVGENLILVVGIVAVKDAIGKFQVATLFPIHAKNSATPQVGHVFFERTVFKI